MNPRDLLVAPADSLSGSVRAPGSKSVTHRSLEIAALAEGESLLDNSLISGDTRSTIEALRGWGVTVEESGNQVRVEGTGGLLSMSKREVDLGNSGTSLRFLTTLAGLVPGRSVLTGDESLRSRPMGDLLGALKVIGVDARSVNDNGAAPIEVNGTGRVRGGEVSIRGSVSSQFISSLLMPGSYFEDGIALGIVGELKSGPYVKLTSHVMSSFGIEPARSGSTISVPSGRRFSGRSFQVDGDYSSSSFLMCAAALTGSAVEVTGLRQGSHQADERFTSILKAMGCAVERSGDSVRVEGAGLSGIEVDLSESPDLLPPVAVLAAVAEGNSRITGVEHARLKESDRITAIHQEFGRLGISTTERADGIEFPGGARPRGREAFSWGDHRIAMALVVLGLVSDGMVVRGASCIPISYPGFYEDMRSLGAKLKWV